MNLVPWLKGHPDHFIPVPLPWRVLAAPTLGLKARESDPVAYV